MAIMLDWTQSHPIGQATAKSPIYRVKTEAIALTPDLGVFLASDDEHMGSGIFTSEATGEIHE